MISLRYEDGIRPGLTHCTRISGPAQSPFWIYMCSLCCSRWKCDVCVTWGKESLYMVIGVEECTHKRVFPDSKWYLVMLRALLHGVVDTSASKVILG